jgi:hypothetical protein
MEQPILRNVFRILKARYLVAAVALWSLQAVVTIAQTVDVIEYYNASQDHYFISSLQPDINALDSGHFPGWARTGLTFRAYPTATANASPVCRFYIPPAYGDSHFYSASPAECAAVQARFPQFILESSNVMYVDLPDPATGACPVGDIPVYRVWDHRVDTNHRYTTDVAIRAQMIAKGWVAEGYGPNLVIMCAPPPAASATLLLSLDGTTVYDIANNVSWLADANLPAVNRFGLPLCTGSGTQTCVNASGSMRYDAAVAWVQAMNAASYLGHSNWQLPTTPTNDSGCGKTGPNGSNFGFGCTASAFGSLWNALGLKAPDTAVPIPSNTVGPFSNFQPYLYWSQSGAPPPAGNFTFSFATGWQGANTLPNFLYVLPMLPGKLPGTPPATGNGLQINPGGQTVYDPVTNITWLANANLAATNTFGLPTCTDPTTPAICVAPDGAMTFAAASQFIGNMNTFNGVGYLDQTNWQLPTIASGCPGYNCAGNQNPMGNLFYGQLNFSQGMTVVTAPNIDVGPFNNIQPYLYWSCQAATIQDVCQPGGPVPNQEWSFSLGSGFEGTDLLANDLYVTAYFVGPPTP